MEYIVVKLFPAILNDERLHSVAEKWFCSYIYGWQSQGKVCFANDELICSILGICGEELQDMIKTLAKRKIIQLRWEPNRRFLFVLPGQEEVEDPDIFAGL